MDDSDRYEIVEYDAEVVRVTALALLVNIDGDEYWLPKSQLKDEGDLGEASEAGDKGSIAIPRWLAEDKGIE